MLRRTWAITQKEFIQLLHFPLVLIGLTVGVALELILFAVAIHNNVTHVPMVVSDQSRSGASQSYLAAFTVSSDFDIVAMVPDQAGVIRAIDSGQASIGLVIPVDFATRVQQKDANVLMVVDGSDSLMPNRRTAMPRRFRSNMPSALLLSNSAPWSPISKSSITPTWKTCGLSCPVLVHFFYMALRLN